MVQSVLYRWQSSAHFSLWLPLMIIGVGGGVAKAKSQQAAGVQKAAEVQQTAEVQLSSEIASAALPALSDHQKPPL